MGSSQLKYNFEHFEVSFPVEYVALVAIDRPNKMNSFKEPYVTPHSPLPVVLDTVPLSSSADSSSTKQAKED